MKRYDYQKELSLRLAACDYKCTGCDAINSLYPITKLMDESRGTDHHKKFVHFLREVKEARLRMHSNPHGREGRQEEAFVRVVKKDEKGIYVSGAKVH